MTLLRPVLLAILTLVWSESTAFAQSNPRNSFPGQRVGGGTRGECTSRIIAHLVPPTSIYAPAADRTLGLLEGPIRTPQPLQLEFRQFGAASNTPGFTRELPPAPAGITLITLPDQRPTLVWSSSYRCGGTSVAIGTDPLAFIDGGAPPAQSLLVKDVTAADRTAQASLARLRKACGQTISSQEAGREFGLSDVITADWPAVLPVRCL